MEQCSVKITDGLQEGFCTTCKNDADGSGKEGKQSGQDLCPPGRSTFLGKRELFVTQASQFCGPTVGRKMSVFSWIESQWDLKKECLKRLDSAL